MLALIRYALVLVIYTFLLLIADQKGLITFDVEMDRLGDLLHGHSGTLAPLTSEGSQRSQPQTSRQDTPNAPEQPEENQSLERQRTAEGTFIDLFEKEQVAAEPASPSYAPTPAPTPAPVQKKVVRKKKEKDTPAIDLTPALLLEKGRALYYVKGGMTNAIGPHWAGALFSMPVADWTTGSFRMPQLYRVYVREGGIEVFVDPKTIKYKGVHDGCDVWTIRSGFATPNDTLTWGDEEHIVRDRTTGRMRMTCWHDTTLEFREPLIVPFNR